MKKILIIALLLCLAGCSSNTENETAKVDQNPTKTLEELKLAAQSTFKGFDELNSALNNSDAVENCDGECFVFQPEGQIEQYIAQFQAYSIYNYVSPNGGNASAVFKLNTESEPYFYEVVLAGMQDYQLCSVLEEKSIPAEIIAECVDEKDNVINRLNQS